MSDPEYTQKNIIYLIEDQTRRSGGGSAGGGEPPSDIEKRLKALEEGHKLIISKLVDIADGVRDLRYDNEKRFSGLENRLTAIETKLDTKAAKTDLTEIEVKLAHLDGRVANIPTAWSTFFLILGAIVTTVASIAGLGFTFAKFLKP